MKRLCFDIASDFYSPFGWLNGPKEARACFRNNEFKFYAATAFDDAQKDYLYFADYNDLYTCLSAADEIITFNGRKCDLIVLEHWIGEEAMKKLWRKPHHDLTGWRGYWSLESSIKKHLPGVAPAFWATLHDHKRRLTSTLTDEFIIGKLANTHRDVSFTYMLFELYRQSGEITQTFNDSDL